jgi:hypothetical protein
MPQINVQDQTYERMQRHAKPFVDTPDTIINLALDALEHAGSQATTPIADNTTHERRIDPRMLPNLTHTKVLDAWIEGETIPKANWNSLLSEMLRRSMKQVGTFDRLKQLCPVNIVKGRKEDEGYTHLSDINVSVQGQDANGACRAVVTAAQGLGIAIDIGFMWRHNEGAIHPGERARLQVGGRKTASK